MKSNEDPAFEVVESNSNGVTAIPLIDMYGCIFYCGYCKKLKNVHERGIHGHNLHICIECWDSIPDKSKIKVNEKGEITLIEDKEL